MSMRSNQRGSVVGFVIVGIVLASSVAGGVYFVNQRDKQALNQPTAAAQQPAASPQPSKTSSDSDKSSEESTSRQSTNGATSGRGQTSTPTTGVDANHLPSTGPADQALQLIALGVLAGALTAFIRSQRRKSHAASF